MGLHPPLPLLLPIGISFYTFMAISYVVDLSRLEIMPSRFLDVSVYLAFFPHLIAGRCSASSPFGRPTRRSGCPSAVTFHV